MIRDTLARVAADFGDARQETFAGHPLADWLRKTAPSVLEADLEGLSEVRIVASPGKGNWGHGPWQWAFRKCPAGSDETTCR